MPLHDNAHYVDSVGYAAVAAWAAATAVTAGSLKRQTSPAVNSERVFVALDDGTTHATTEPTWVITRGGKTTDNDITWQECTGLAGVNGDATNTPSWAELKAITSAGVLGQLVKNNAGTHLFIMSTAGTIGASEPAFSTTTGGTTTDNGATWTCIGAMGAFAGNAAPHARIAGALATNWAAAGNNVFVKSSHAATHNGTITWLGAGTAAAPIKLLCHDGGAYPPIAANLTTGGGETTTGVSNIQTQGNLYVEGITMTAAANGGSVLASSSAGTVSSYKNCTFRCTHTGVSQSIFLGGGSIPVNRSIFENCSFEFGNVVHQLWLEGYLEWRGEVTFSGQVPTNLLRFFGTGMNSIDIRGIDFSVFGSGKTIVPADTAVTGLVRFTNCKFNALATKAAAVTSPRMVIDFINCDSGDTNYNNERHSYFGVMTTETIIVRTGGASDGTTPAALKLVTSANPNRVFPFECPPVAIWNETVGSAVTVSIEGIWGGGAVPTDADIWMELNYLGDASFPLGSFASEGPASILTAGVAQEAGSGTWGGSTTKFKMSKQITPQQKGLIVARVMAAKASDTFYVDPKITLN